MVKRDIVAFNRMYLLMAREAAKMRAGELLTGLSKQTLDILAEMSIDEIDRLAQDAGASLISLRVAPDHLRQLVDLDADRRKAYAAIVLSKELSAS